MVKHRLTTLRLILMLADGLTAAAVFMLVSLVRFGDGESDEFWRNLGIDTRVAAIVFGVTWVAALWLMDLYRLRVRWRLVTEARDIAKTTVVVVLLTLSTLFVLNQPGVSRLFLVMLFVVQPLVTLVGRASIRYYFGILRRRGMNIRYMLIAGTGSLAQDFANLVETRTTLGIRVIGHLSVEGEPERVVSRPILGTAADIESIFSARVVDEIAICAPTSIAPWRQTVATIAANEGKTVRVVLYPLNEVVPTGHQEDFEGFLVRSPVHDARNEFGHVAKRLIDVTGAAVGLALLSPVLIGTALAIRLRDGSPVLFRQTRVGLQGRPFTMYKFRTMVPNAESLLAELWAQSTITGPAIQLDDDPRVTRLGRLLRRTSLDELPQLWNVLQGNMSLVGPRPAPIVEVERYGSLHRRRLSVKPGITGLAQATLRTYRDFEDRAALDMQYIDTWSIWLDFKIMARTVAVIVGSTGR